MNIVKATGEKAVKDHNLTLTNREKLVVTGIEKVKSANDKSVLILLPNTTLYIGGSNLQVNQLDLHTGILEIVGLVDEIKYGNGKPLLKRIFK